MLLFLRLGIDKLYMSCITLNEKNCFTSFLLLDEIRSHMLLLVGKIILIELTQEFLGVIIKF